MNFRVVQEAAYKRDDEPPQSAGFDERPVTGRFSYNEVTVNRETPPILVAATANDHLAGSVHISTYAALQEWLNGLSEQESKVS